jgi:hypothetical protein
LLDNKKSSKANRKAQLREEARIKSRLLTRRLPLMERAKKRKNAVENLYEIYL